jgi:hypothetical protein
MTEEIELKSFPGSGLIAASRPYPQVRRDRPD